MRIQMESGVDFTMEMCCQLATAAAEAVATKALNENRG